MSGAENGAERAENRVERNGAVSVALQNNDGAERSVEREVAERERSGERGLQKWVGALTCSATDFGLYTSFVETVATKRAV